VAAYIIVNTTDSGPIYTTSRKGSFPCYIFINASRLVKGLHAA
jgi:hypothetical protein